MISLQKYSYKFILIHSTIKSHNWGNKATSATISHMIQLILFLFRPSFCCFFPWFETSVRFLSAVVLFMVLPAGTISIWIPVRTCIPACIHIPARIHILACIRIPAHICTPVHSAAALCCFVHSLSILSHHIPHFCGSMPVMYIPGFIKMVEYFIISVRHPAQRTPAISNPAATNLTLLTCHKLPPFCPLKRTFTFLFINRTFAFFPAVCP